MTDAPEKFVELISPSNLMALIRAFTEEDSDSMEKLIVGEDLGRLLNTAELLIDVGRYLDTLVKLSILQASDLIPNYAPQGRLPTGLEREP